MSLREILFRKKKLTSIIARERLQIILSHERSLSSNNTTPNWLPNLQQELIAVVAKYVKIEPGALKVHLEKDNNLELLEINIALPESGEKI